MVCFDVCSYVGIMFYELEGTYIECLATVNSIWWWYGCFIYWMSLQMIRCVLLFAVLFWCNVVLFVKVLSKGVNGLYEEWLSLPGENVWKWLLSRV